MERKTRQRSAVRDALLEAHRPLTPAEVLERAQRHVAGIGIATVYRAIKALLAEGTVVSVEISGTPPRYEMAHLGHHHHFHCRACSRVFEIRGCPGNLGRLSPPGFKLEGHEVVLYGRCVTCAEAA